jgi:hypothetical protein
MHPAELHLNKGESLMRSPTRIGNTKSAGVMKSVRYIQNDTMSWHDAVFGYKSDWG